MLQPLEYRIQTLETRVDALVAFLGKQQGIDGKELAAALRGIMPGDDEAPGKLD